MRCFSSKSFAFAQQSYPGRNSRALCGNSWKKIHFFVLIVGLLLIVNQNVLAETQHKKLWLNIGLYGDLSEKYKLKYLMDGELRFTDQDGNFETVRGEIGAGYQALPNLIFWAAVQRISANQTPGGAGAENRLWQQAIWDIIDNDDFNLFTRTRIEERFRADQPGWNYRFRERVNLLLIDKIAPDYSPLIYDEVFFLLNKPVWQNDKTFSENRLFVGLNINLSEQVVMQIGYLNQYIFHQTENEMNHVLSITLNVNN
jgi:hypothetical protein